MRIPRPINPNFRTFAHFCACVAIACAAVSAASQSPVDFRSSTRDFDARSMMGPTGSGPFPGSGAPASAFRMGGSGRFSMRQSYSLTAMSGPGGSTSSGLYLNTLMYRLSAPLTVFTDVGFYSQLHSTVPGLQQEGGPGSLVIPRVGLEYKPTERLTMNLELVNGADAYKAYGGMPWPSNFTSGSQSP